MLYRYDFKTKTESAIKSIKIAEGQDVDIGYNINFS